MRLLFQILIGFAALFIAGCSAYFSVSGLGLLFVGSATAVMVMAASLEIGKLVAASFLYQYWSRIGVAVRLYLMLAVGVLVCITSLGIYGYLARAYERTNSDVTLLQDQATSVQREIADVQQRIDGSRSQIGKLSDAERADVEKLQQQVPLANQSLEQSLTRLDERRKAARDKRDRTTDKLQQQVTQSNQSHEQALARLEERRKAAGDKRNHEVERLTASGAESAKVLVVSLASEDAEVASLNDRIAVLDRAVDAYTREGGAGFLKEDSIKKGQALRKEQQPQRDIIANEIAEHRKSQEKMRAARAAAAAALDAQVAGAREQFTKDTAAIDDEGKSLQKSHAEAGQALDAKIAAAGEQFTKDSAALDEEEKSLRKGHADSVAAAQQQLAALQAKGQAIVDEGGSQIGAMYERIRTGNEEIRRLRQQIAATDVGSYRFVARAFNAPVDDVVKWLILIIVLVFDPLAVALTIGFNVALASGRRPRSSAAIDATSDVGSTTATAATTPKPHNRGVAAVTAGAVILATIFLGGAAYGVASLLHSRARAAYASLVPDDSFAVVALSPGVLRQSAAPKSNTTTASTSLLGQPIAAAVSELLGSGFDTDAEVYVFLKYPSARSDKPADHPVILCGLVARVTDPVAAEAALSRCAEAIDRSLRPPSATVQSLTRSRVMVQSGRGRYLDPEGGFLTFGLTENGAVLLLEIEGIPAHPSVEQEIRLCLSREDSPASPAGAAAAEHCRPLPNGSAVALWFNGARCFADMPKSPAALARYQQLQRYLDFDLSLVVQPVGVGQVNVVGQYTYAGERFRAGGTPAVLDLLAKLGPSNGAGISGRLMDRCADTLDFDSLIDHLRLSLSTPHPGGSPARVVVERTSSSVRDARFVVTAKYDPQAGPPLTAAFRSLAQF